MAHMKEKIALQAQLSSVITILYLSFEKRGTTRTVSSQEAVRILSYGMVNYQISKHQRAL